MRACKHRRGHSRAHTCRACSHGHQELRVAQGVQGTLPGMAHVCTHACTRVYVSISVCARHTHSCVAHMHSTGSHSGHTHFQAHAHPLTPHQHMRTHAAQLSWSRSGARSHPRPHSRLPHAVHTCPDPNHRKQTDVRPASRPCHGRRAGWGCPASQMTTSPGPPVV